MPNSKSTHQGMMFGGKKNFVTLQTRPWQPFEVFPGGNGPISSKLESAISELPRVIRLSNLVNIHLFRCTRRWQSQKKKFWKIPFIALRAGLKIKPTPVPAFPPTLAESTIHFLNPHTTGKKISKICGAYSLRF